MKTRFFFLFAILVFCPTDIFSQQSTTKFKTHKAWVTFINGSKVIKGELYSVSETAIVILKKEASGNLNYIPINAQNIDVINLRRKGKVGRGMWRGALAGFGTGVLLGIADGDESNGTSMLSTEETALIFGAFFSAVGSGVGAAVASSKLVLPIHGDLEVFSKYLAEIQSYSINKNVKY